MTEKEMTNNNDIKEEEIQKEDVANPTLIETVERLEKANEKREDLLRREEELAARGLLGGISSGAKQESKPVEETPSDYARRVMKGDF